VVKNVYLYIEGGGDRIQQQSELRAAFKILLEKAGFRGRLPRIVACGGRDQAYQQFKKAFGNRSQADLAILLIDSEDPLNFKDATINAPIWQHLLDRDKWEKPAAAHDNQVALMVTSMETWIMADQMAIRSFFGAKVKEKYLLPAQNLEARTRKDVFGALEKATEDCGKDRQYRKGSKSFQLLATVNPQTLRQHLPHFQRFIDVLQHHLA
jgi:Domain of unknown function (DUF4276)